MESHQIDITDAHKYLGSQFDGADDSVLCAVPDFARLFASASELKFWHYDHYVPLKNLVENFLPMNESLRKCVSDYQHALSEFYGATKISDFVKLSNQEKSDEAMQRCMKLNSRLKIILRVEDSSAISEITLDYVDILWKTFIKELSLSPCTAIINDITCAEDRLEITWLVLYRTASRIKATYSKALRFYQKHNIECVSLNQGILYDVELIVSSKTHATPCICIIYFTIFFLILCYDYIEPMVII